MDYKKDNEVLSIFLEETKEHLSDLENGILELERGPINRNLSLIESLFRAAHSIKASANLMELKNIEMLSHELENILDLCRQRKLVMDQNTVDCFLKGIDTIKNLLEFRQYSDEIDVSPMTKMLNKLVT